MYDHRAVTLICFECDQDFSNGSGCTQHGNLVGETDTSERRPAIARRFPVRGLDASHDRGASLKWLGRCLRRFLSPCSNRGTDKSEGRQPPPCLRPLFAQGDLMQTERTLHRVPSTPVRTGRPPAARNHYRGGSGDPGHCTQGYGSSGCGGNRYQSST